MIDVGIEKEKTEKKISEVGAAATIADEEAAKAAVKAAEVGAICDEAKR